MAWMIAKACHPVHFPSYNKKNILIKQSRACRCSCPPLLHVLLFILIYVNIVFFTLQTYNITNLLSLLIVFTNAQHKADTRQKKKKTESNVLRMKSKVLSMVNKFLRCLTCFLLQGYITQVYILLFLF